MLQYTDSESKVCSLHIAKFHRVAAHVVSSKQKAAETANRNMTQNHYLVKKEEAILLALAMSCCWEDFSTATSFCCSPADSWRSSAYLPLAAASCACTARPPITAQHRISCDPSITQQHQIICAPSTNYTAAYELFALHKPMTKTVTKTVTQSHSET